VIQKDIWKQSAARIMVIDDESVILDLLECLLTQGGYEVETIDRADAVLDKLESEEYDLILLDIKMPGMNGIELYRRIEKSAPALARRVVFITGDVLETTTRNFLDEASPLYILKPFDNEKLEKEINQMLAKRLVS